VQEQGGKSASLLIYVAIIITMVYFRPIYTLYTQNGTETHKQNQSMEHTKRTEKYNTAKCYEHHLQLRVVILTLCPYVIMAQCAYCKSSSHSSLHVGLCNDRYVNIATEKVQKISHQSRAV